MDKTIMSVFATIALGILAYGVYVFGRRDFGLLFLAFAMLAFWQTLNKIKTTIQSR